MSRSAVITASRPPGDPLDDRFASTMAVRNLAFIIMEFDWTCPRVADTSRNNRWRPSISGPICTLTYLTVTAAGCAATPSKEDWMQFPVRCVGRMMGAVLAMTCALSIAAWAGGAGFGDDDDNSEEEGPSYFGFVRDTNGATVPDAKVTVGVKNRGGIVTRTDLLGTYKVPGFGKEVDPKDVEVSCDKPGYKQLRVVRRSSPSIDPKIPVETECTLQRI